MAAQKRKKIFGKIFFIFESLLLPPNPSNQAKPSTLLILPVQMEDYHKIWKQEALGD